MVINKGQLVDVLKLFLNNTPDTIPVQIQEPKTGVLKSIKRIYYNELSMSIVITLED